MTTATTDKVEEAPVIDWAAISAPVIVEGLHKSKSIEDIPVQIRTWIDEAFEKRDDSEGGKAFALTFPSGVVAKVFEREARDYCTMHTPRFTLRLAGNSSKPNADGSQTVRFKVTLHTSANPTESATK